MTHPKLGIGGAPIRPSTMPKDAAGRKKTPLASGVTDYFPDALLAVAQVSFAGNEQHNPGQPLNWAREKSTDESDTLLRHFMERGTLDSDGLPHSAKLSWRALALLQKELELRGAVLKFGKRTVLGLAVGNGKRQKWRVRCDCGHEYECLTQDLKRKGGAGCRRCAHKGERVSRRKRPYEWRYNSTVNRARHGFFISYEEFFAHTKTTECHYCGERINWGPAFGKRRLSGLNLDRKDSNLPYTTDNVVVACRRCNYGKNNFFSYDEWVQLGNLIRSWRKQ